MNKNSTTLEARALAQMTQMTHEPLNVSMSKRQWFGVVATLQLATRHPQFKESLTAAEIRQFIAQVGAAVAEGRPDIATIISRGCNPDFDEQAGAV